MTKADLLAAAKGKPSPFEFEGFTYLLRPLSWGERKELFDWHRANEASPESGLELQRRLLTLGVCDETGDPLLTEPDDLRLFALPIADAISKEVARRNGLDGKAGAPGKAE